MRARYLICCLLVAMLAMLPCRAEEALPCEPEFVAELEEFDLPAEDAEPPAAVAAEGASFAMPERLTLGAKEQCDLIAEPVALPLTFTSSKPKYASVDASGRVTGRNRGSAVITCSLNGQVLGTCAVTVMRAPKKLTLPASEAILNAGDVRAFAASLPSDSAGRVEYESSDPSVLAVDGAGNVAGVGAGAATLTARAYNGVSAKCAFRVLAGPAPKRVTLDRTALTMAVKDTAQLTAACDEGSEAVLSYSSSKTAVATVSDTGLITAKRVGHTTVTVRAHNGITAECAVTVCALPKKISVSPASVTLNVNEGCQLTAALPANTWSEIRWSSSNPRVAEVDADGLVAGIGMGRATITATTANGKAAACTVRVTDPNADPNDPAARGDVLYREESASLKVTVVNDEGVCLAYVWAKNPSEQLFKQYGADLPADILRDAVEKRGLRNKTLVGFNASPPVNTKYRAAWNRDARYHHREPSPLMIANGEVLVNDPEQLIKEKYLFWLDGDGQLRATDREINDYTVEERRALYQAIIESGARNTMIWRPVLVEDYKIKPLTESFKKSHPKKHKHQALAQMDDHTFVVVSCTGAREMTYARFQEYLVGLGCRMAVEFDAGGSTAQLFKSRYSNDIVKVTGGNRPLTMMMYFTEE